MIEKSGEALYSGGCLVGFLISCLVVWLQHWAEISNVQQYNLTLGIGNELNDGMIK